MRRVSSSLFFAAVALVTWGASASGFREDEVVCEEAVALLKNCCSSFQPIAIACHHERSDQPVGCLSYLEPRDQDPDIDEATSTCLRAMGCEDLVAQGVCERAATSAAHAIATGGVPQFAGVCP